MHNKNKKQKKTLEEKSKVYNKTFICFTQLWGKHMPSYLSVPHFTFESLWGKGEEMKERFCYQVY